MSWIKKACFISIGWFLGLIFMLVAFEVALRLIYNSDNDLSSGGYKNGGAIPSQVASELSLLPNFQHEYDVKKYFKAKESKVRYARDKFGLRNACGMPKNIDILTIGGSTTNQRYVKDESTYQAVIEKLVLDNEGKEICVANAGIDGHSTYGHIRAFQEWFPLLPDLKPKYILLYVGINDADFIRNYELVFQEGSHPPGAKKRPIKTFIRKTYLAQKTRPFFQYLRGETEERKFQQNTAKYQENNYVVTNLSDDTVEKVKKHVVAFRNRFERLLQLVDEIGATPICITQPHNYARRINGQLRGVERHSHKYNGLDFDYSLQQVNKVIYELCGEDNFIDMYSVKINHEMFYDAMHTTDIGSEFIGQKIYEAMKQKGMLEVF